MKSTMPKESKQKWLDGLRSGEYAQCKGSLSDGKGFCCLGVLEMVVDSEVEKAGEKALGTPSYEWLEKNNIQFRYHKYNALVENPSFEIPAYVKVSDEIKLEFCYIDKNNKIYCSASCLNDKLNLNFNQIADIIEEQVEGV